MDLEVWRSCLYFPYAHLPQPAIRTDKEAAVRGFGLPLSEGLRIEAECFNRSIHDPATMEGLRQFTQRDHPDRQRDQPPRTPGLVREEGVDKSMV